MQDQKNLQEDQLNLKRNIQLYSDYFQIDKLDHFIFGKIKIYQQWNVRQNLLFRKIHFNQTAEEHEQDIFEVQDRIRINHPNLLNLMNYTSILPDDDHPYYQINIIYDYPDRFFKPIYEYVKSQNIKVSSYFIICLGVDILNAIQHLKQNQMFHGDIRPRYIAISSDRKNQFILCDRLKHSGDAFELQKQYLYSKNNRRQSKKVYWSPNLLKSICQNNRELMGSEYKNEMFSLGLLMLEMGCSRDIQDIYDMKNGNLNNDKFLNHINYMAQRYSHDKILMKFVTQLLTANQEKMPSAKEMLLTIQRIKGKMNERVKMGLDDFKKIYERHENDYDTYNSHGTKQNPHFHNQDFIPLQNITVMNPQENIINQPMQNNRERILQAEVPQNFQNSQFTFGNHQSQFKSVIEEQKIIKRSYSPYQHKKFILQQINKSKANYKYKHI